MSLEFKRRFNENLDLIPVYIEDTSLTSEAYFGIKEFPSFFGRGKNGVRVKPNEDILKPNSQLYIEILDVNLNSVYYEIPDYEPGDLSRYISVWVYGERDDMYNTPNGIGEMIICGIAERTEDGEIIPEEFRDVINVRWRRKISISRDSRSESPIVFSQIKTLQPKLSISESISSYLNFADENGQLLMVSESINETIVYSSDFAGENVFLTLPTTSSYNFSSNLPGNKIYFNLQNVTLSPTITSAEGSAGLLKPVNYTASVESIVNSKKLRVSNPLTASVTTKFESILKTFTSFSTGSFIIEVPTTGSQTPFSQSLLHITLNDVNPIIGNIDKINVYIRPKSFETTNQYKFVGTKILNSTISSSITDIYSNTDTNFTQSTHTFIYQAEKQNDLNDIKIEFVNSLNDESLYFIEKKDAFLAGYNKIDSSSFSQIQTIQQTIENTIIKTEITASSILVSNNNNNKQYSTNGGTTASLNTLTFRDTDTTSDVTQSIGRIAFESFDADTSGSNNSRVVRAFIEAVSEDDTPDAFLAFGTAVSGALAQERIRINASGNVGIGTSSPTERLHVDGNMIVTGRITAEEFHTEFVSASIIYQSGSTQFGNTLDDTHIFTGSLRQSGSDSYFLGNVGIGTTTPSARLVVAGNGFGTALIGDLFGGSNYTGISLNNTNVETEYNFLSSPTDKHLYINRPSTRDISFRENNVDQVTILTGGNVGIGTISPTDKLDVNGSTIIRDNLIISGSTTLGQSSNEIVTSNVGFITAPDYVSGFAGRGWRLDYTPIESNLKSSLDLDNLTVRGQLRVYELIINQIRATNGSLFVSSVGKAVSASFISGEDYFLTFDTSSGDIGHGFTKGDIIRAQRVNRTALTGSGVTQNVNSNLVYQSDLTVRNVTNLSSLTASLSAGSTPPSGGMDFVRLGNSESINRQGTIYLTSDDSHAPFIDVVDGIKSHSEWNNASGSGGVKVRMGKLNGITSPTFGPLTASNSSSLYGFWASGSAYLEGGINATVGNIAGWNITSTAITKSGIELNSNQNYISLGDITPQTSTTASSTVTLGFAGSIDSDTSTSGSININGVEFYVTTSLTPPPNNPSSSPPIIYVRVSPGASAANQVNAITASLNFSSSISPYNTYLGDIIASRFSVALRLQAKTPGTIGNSYYTQPIIPAGSQTNFTGGSSQGTGVLLSGSGEAVIGNATGSRISFINNNLVINASNATLKGNTVEISGSNFHLLNGNITASNVRLSGTITASAGLIGGFNTTTTEIVSTGSFTSASFTSPFISLKANGQITGSDVLFIKPITSGGASGSIFTMIDTSNNFIDVANVGRQIVQDYTGMTIVGTNTNEISSSDCFYPIQFLPGENALLVACSLYGSLGNGSTLSVQTATHSMQVSISSASFELGYHGPGDVYFDQWGGETNLFNPAPFVPTSTSGDKISSRTIVPSGSINVGIVGIPTGFQGKYCLLKLKLRHQNATFGTTSATAVRGLNITATRNFAANIAQARAPQPPVSIFVPSASYNYSSNS